MSIPPADYRDGLNETDLLLLERQRRRYASRAIAYLVLLNGVAAFILLASLPHFAGQITHPRRMLDAMLVFGIGAAIALGSTFCLCASHRETASSGADSATGLFVVVVCFSRPSGSGMLSDRS